MLSESVERMTDIQKWESSSKRRVNRRQHGGKINSALEMTSLSSYLASSDSEWDKSPRRTPLFQRTSKVPSHLNLAVPDNNAVFGLKEQRAYTEGEELTKKLIVERKLTEEQVFGEFLLP